MTDEHIEAEEKLKRLGERVRKGWDKMYRLKEEHLQAARKVVETQWKKEERARNRIRQIEQAERAHRSHQKTKEPEKTHEQDQSQSSGHSEGHDHSHDH